MAASNLARLGSFLCLLAAASTLAVRGPAPTPDPALPAGSAPRAGEVLGRLPAAFVANRGQWHFDAPYVARIGPLTAFVEADGWTFTLAEPRRVEHCDVHPAARAEPVPAAPVSRRGVAVRMRLAACSPRLCVAPGPELPGRYNYFLGADPAGWRTDVPGHASVRLADAYPGIDVDLKSSGGQLEYDLLLAPGADLSRVHVLVEGAEHLSLDGDGALVMRTALGPIRQPLPRTWQVGPRGEQLPVACRYVLLGPDRFGFVAPGWQRDLALVVDPVLHFSTFLGAAGDEEGVGLFEDPSRSVTVCGYTTSPAYPATTGAYDTSHNGGSDAFVSRVAADGATLVFSTFLGSTGEDLGRGVFVAPNQLITAIGYTASATFPTTTGAYDTTHNGGNDWWVARLGPLGNTLMWSTFVGGTGSDSPRTVRVETNGNVTVSGVTGAGDFPTTAGAYDQSYNGSSQDIAAIRLDPLGASLIWATFIGSTGVDYALAMDLAPNGAVIMTGYASATDYPSTTGAYDTSWNGAFDAFVTKLNPSGATLDFSTFLGATGNDIGYALAVDANGVTTVAGETDGSGGFPTTAGAFQTVFKSTGGTRDSFVTRINATGTALVWSTLLGGQMHEFARGLALERDGSAVVSGDTQSTDFPVTPGAQDTTHNGVRDVFVSKIGPTGKVLHYSTYLGGTGNDYGNEIRVGLVAEVATLTGRTESATFPSTPGAYDPTHNGGFDAFVTRLALDPAGVRRYGGATASCNGDVASYAVGDATAGNAAFGFACWKAPPSSAGAHFYTINALTTGLPILGVTIWVDPATLFLVVVAPSDAQGNAGYTLPLPPGTQSIRFHTQFLWANTASCGGAGTWSASDALQVTVQ